MAESGKDNILRASSLAEVCSALKTLHVRDKALDSSLSTLLSKQTDVKRDISRLDPLHAILAGKAVATRSIHTSLMGTTGIVGRLPSQIHRLSMEKARVEDTLQLVDQVIELKACIAGVVGSMAAPQDWEAAAGYVSRASKIPETVVRGDFAAAVVPTIEVPDIPWIALENAKENFCGPFLRQFQKAAKEGDIAEVTRVFKLFPLIERSNAGLDAYGQYVCQSLSDTAKAMMKDMANNQDRNNDLFLVNALTRLFKHVAHILEGHGGLVKQHYGDGKMVQVIERIQLEVDIHGGIIIDAWSDDKEVDRKLTDVRSYPFSFLASSILSHSIHGGTSRPTISVGQDGQNTLEDEGIDLRELDRLLGEMAMILGQWSLYSRFLANKYHDSKLPNGSHLSIPPLLTTSRLHRKISERLINPYNTIATFHFRRSVERAFELDTPLTGLSLSQPITANAPFILQAVEDTMYCVSIAIQKSVSTAQNDVISSVVPAIGRILGSDFLGIIQRKMWNESFWRSEQAALSPHEGKIIAFIVLLNSLDTSEDYLGRIVNDNLNMFAQRASSQESNLPPKVPAPPLDDLTSLTHELSNLNKTFSTKITALLDEGLQDFFMHVIKRRLRSVLSSSFRGADYSLSENEFAELIEESVEPQVSEQFELGWDNLIKPMSRIMTPKIFAAILERIARYLAIVLEKRIWDYAGRTNAFSVLRMDRDFSGIVSVVSRYNYGVRDVFARVLQILMAANIEEEWQEQSEDELEMKVQWVLNDNERMKARQLVSF